MKLYGLKMTEDGECDYWIKFASDRNYLEAEGKETFDEYVETNPFITGYEIEDISDNQKVIDYILSAANEWVETDGGEIE